MRSAFMIMILIIDAFFGYGYDGSISNDIDIPVHRNPRAPHGFHRMMGTWSIEYEDEQNDTFKYTDEEETNDLWELLKKFSNMDGRRMGEDLK